MPNTLDPRLLGLDWAYIDCMFAPYLHLTSRVPNRDRNSHLMAFVDRNTLDPETLNDGDVALKNLVGLGAADTAGRWADDGKLLKKLDLIRLHLDTEEKALIDSLIGKFSVPRPIEPRLKDTPSTHPTHTGRLVTKSMPTVSHSLNKRRDLPQDSEDDTDDDDDERGRTAHFLFANLAGIDPQDKENAWWLVSPPSDQDKGQRLVSGSSGGSKRGGRNGETVRDGNGRWRLDRLTPISSPLGPFRGGAHNSATPESPLRPADKLSSSMLPSSPPVRTVPLLASPFSFVTSSPLAGSSTTGLTRFHPQDKASSSPLHDKHVSPKVTSLAKHGPSLKTHSRSKGKRPYRPFMPSTPVRRQRTAVKSGEDNDPKKRRLNETTRAIPSTPPSAMEFVPVVVNTTSRGTSGPFIVPITKTSIGSSSPASSVPWVPTEREHWHATRLAMSEKIAAALPGMVKPSFRKKRERQVKQLERKMERRGEGESWHGDRAKRFEKDRDGALRTSSRRLMPEPTLLSFEPIHDESESKMDWNRSRLLAEAIREDVKRGKKPIIPPLQCAQSQSP